MSAVLFVFAFTLAASGLYMLWSLRRKPVEKPKPTKRLHRVIPDNWPRK